MSKRLTAPYRSGPSRDWIKVRVRQPGTVKADGRSDGFSPLEQGNPGIVGLAVSGLIPPGSCWRWPWWAVPWRRGLIFRPWFEKWQAASQRTGALSKWQGVSSVQDATGQNVAWFYFRDDPTVAPSAAVLLKQRARRRAVNFAGPLLDEADRDRVMDRPALQQ